MSTPDASVTVVVLNWNGWRHTLACLRSLQRMQPVFPNVVVVDNGSRDDSVRQIRSAFPAATILENEANLGFAAGANVGIRHAVEHGARFVWLLNNDAVATPDCLAAMLEAMTVDPAIGIVGSIVRTAGGGDVEAWGGGTLNRLLGTTRRNSVPKDIDYVAGTSMLIRREVFDRIGLLDEDFFFYLEDVDFSRRAMAGGWRIAVAPTAVVFHRGGETVNAGSPERSVRADRYHVRSSGIFIGKHAGVWAAPAAAVRLSGIALRRASRGQLRRIPALGSEFVRGVSFGMRARRLGAAERVLRLGDERRRVLAEARRR